jgi:hypothetical protein
MHAKNLKKGDAVLISSESGRVIEATYLKNSGSTCYFRAPCFAGQDGPEDEGICGIPVEQVHRRVTRGATRRTPCLTPV